MEQEHLRLEEEKMEKMKKEQINKRNQKKMIALQSLEKALCISHNFGGQDNLKKRVKNNDPQKTKETAKTEKEDEHITSNPLIMEQISRLRIAISKKQTQFGTKLGILNDLFSALDATNDGAVQKNDFLLAMKHVGLKSQSSNLTELVDALDVDGDGDVSFVELCDGLMRRMQDAKTKHGEKMKRLQKEKEKREKEKRERKKNETK